MDAGLVLVVFLGGYVFGHLLHDRVLDIWQHVKDKFKK